MLKSFRIIFVLALILTANIIFAAKEDFITITHFSKSLGKNKNFNVYIPKDAKPGEKFPVLFIMHGAYGSCSDWLETGNAGALAVNYRMILVLPDGNPFGWYVDSPIEKDSQYETYISKELVEFVDKTFPTVASREGRGIMGLSMGGHGAMLMAVKHPDVFSSASSLSGILKITNHPDKWQIAGRLGTYTENKQIWEANSVYDLAEKYKDANVKIMFDCGVDDTGTGAIGDGRQLHQKLTELKIPHIWRELPGTHSWDYWRSHLEEHLNFHQAAKMSVMPEISKPEKWYFDRLTEFYAENSAICIEEKTDAKSDTAKAAPKTAVLLGSSSMLGMESKLFPADIKIINRGITGDVLGVFTRGVSHRLEESVFDTNPDFVFISNGRNDLGDRKRNGEPSIARMVEEYEKIILKIKERAPKTKICIITCLPTRGKYEDLASPTLSFNNEIKNLAKKHEVPVIDAYKEFAGADGLLKEELTKDGLHTTEKGNAVIADMITKFINAPETK